MFSAITMNKLDGDIFTLFLLKSLTQTAHQNRPCFGLSCI